MKNQPRLFSFFKARTGHTIKPLPPMPDIRKHLEGDVFNTEDLAAIHDRFRGYMPRRKLWGIL